MAALSKKSLLTHPRTCLPHLNATYWNELVIDFKRLDLDENPNSIADYLRYYRKIHNLSRRQLELNSGISLNSIKKYEDKHIFPTREVSNKLAIYFKLSTKYFYDDFYEYKYDISNELRKYRGYNSYVYAAKTIGVHAHTWKNWEDKKHNITREHFHKLKALGVLP